MGQATDQSWAVFPLSSSGAIVLGTKGVSVLAASIDKDRKQSCAQPFTPILNSLRQKV